MRRPSLPELMEQLGKLDVKEPLYIIYETPHYVLTNRCPVCKGKGTVIGDNNFIVTCSNCHGVGREGYLDTRHLMVAKYQTKAGSMKRLIDDGDGLTAPGYGKVYGFYNSALTAYMAVDEIKRQPSI